MLQRFGELAMKSELFLAAALPPHPCAAFQRRALLGEEWILFLEICLEASQESPLSVSSCLCSEHNGLYVTKA